MELVNLTKKICYIQEAYKKLGKYNLVLVQLVKENGEREREAKKKTQEIENKRRKESELHHNFI